MKIIEKETPLYFYNEDEQIPDIVIRVQKLKRSENEDYYRFIVQSPIPEINSHLVRSDPPYFDSEEIRRNPETLLEDILEQLNSMRPDRNNEHFDAQLKSIGTYLYNLLFPDRLKDLYWNYIRNHNLVNNILIISDELWLPWELLRPYNQFDNEEDDFLCEKFGVTRWLPGHFPMSQPIQLNTVKIITSSDSESIEKEVSELVKIFGKRAETVDLNIVNIQEILKKNHFSGMHFACHGKYRRDNPSFSRLYYSRGKYITIQDIRARLNPESPFVFVNACESGRGGESLFGTDGWVKAFISNAKAKGFIGSIWKASGESACSFALKFYEELLTGKNVAEASREARKAIKRVGDPTWLSYAVYAHPLVRISTG